MGGAFDSVAEAGGYRVVGPRIEGGMSAIYRAEEVTSGRAVALKIARGADLESLEREQRALERITHPNVVAYLGRGEVADGVPFLALAWIDGEDLRKKLARGALEVGESVRVASELCAGLAACHALGIVHRDVKPSNVMVDTQGRVTLLDFGLAETSAARASGLGTPAYLAPELIGRRRAVDVRADVYAVGCLLFECLTGAPPFVAETVAQSLLRAMLETAPRVRALRPEVPSWLDELIALLLRKLPEERPRDAHVVHELLRRGGASDPSSSPGGASSREARASTFALLGVGERAGFGDATRDVDESAGGAPAIASICDEFGIALAAPVVDLLVLSAMDADPRDQLRRLLGASARMTELALGVRIAIVSAARGATRDAITRGRALLDEIPPSSAYVDEDTARLAPSGCASFTREALAPGESALRLGPPSPSSSLSLVGRAALLARVAAALARPVADFILLVGEAGIGKTAVLHELCALHGNARPRLLEGQLHLADTPYQAMRSWVSAWLGTRGASDVRSLRAELTRLLGPRGALRAPELGRLLGLTELSSTADGGSRAQLEAALVELISAELAGAPLFIDDAQWLDPASVATLMRLLAEPRRPPIVLAARPELRTKFPELCARASRIEELPRLDTEASLELATRAGPALEASIVRDLVRDAEGHPLVLLELLHFAARGEGGHLPATAIDLVCSRLLGFSAAAKRALGVASALGGAVPRAALADYLAPEELGAALLELRAAGVLRDDPADAACVRFSTSLVEEAAYSMLDEDARVALHTAIAARTLNTADCEPAALRRHAERSHDEGLVLLAQVLVAERALALFDHEAALDAARDGIALGAADELLGRLRLCEAASLSMGARYAEAEIRAREAGELLRPGSPRWVETFSVRMRAAYRRLEPAKMIALFDELAASPVDAGLAALFKLTAMVGLSGDLIVLGFLEVGEAKLAIAEASMRPGEGTDELEPDLCRARARLAQARGEWSRVLSEFERAERLHEARGHLPNAVIARFNRANALFELSEYARAIELGRRAVITAEELELGEALDYGRFMFAVFLRRSGDRAAGKEQLTIALAASEEDPRLAGEVAVELALDALEHDAPEEAALQIKRALTLLEPSPTQIAPACAVQSIILRRAGDPVAALPWAERAREIAAPLGLLVDDLSLIRLSLLEACFALQDPRGPALAREAKDELEERARRVGNDELAKAFLARPYNRRLMEVVLSFDCAESAQG